MAQGTPSRLCSGEDQSTQPPIAATLLLHRDAVHASAPGGAKRTQPCPYPHCAHEGRSPPSKAPSLVWLQAHLAAGSEQIASRLKKRLFVPQTAAMQI